MPYGITGLGGFAQQAPEDFPRFIQFQEEGVDLGDNAVEVVNFTGAAVTATRGTGENTDTLTVDVGAPALTWIDTPGDYTLEKSNAGNGLATSGVTGVQTITIPADTGDTDVDFVDGNAVLVYQEGAAAVAFATAVGVTLDYRATAFLAEIAGQGGIITLIKRSADKWLICGDLAITP